MIRVEGYQAFHGVLRITPKAAGISVREIEADWLYKPEYRCWYGAGMSFSEEICEIVRDDTQRQSLTPAWQEAMMNTFLGGK